MPYDFNILIIRPAGGKVKDFSRRNRVRPLRIEKKETRMNKKKDKKWKEQLLKALDREADKIQQQAEPYKATLSEEKKEEMFRNILARVQESPEPEEEAAATEKKGVMRTPFWRHPLKVAGVLVAVTAAVFGTSLISEGNRMYWLGKWEQLTGGGKVEQSNNGGDSLLTETSEIELREKAKEELGIVVPEFFYMPKDTIFVEGTIDLQQGRVVARYKGIQGYLYLTIDKSENPSVRSEVADTQKVIQMEINTPESDIEILVSEYQEDSALVQQGEWIYKNCHYTFWGILAQTEVVKIMENMYFMS